MFEAPLSSVTVIEPVRFPDSDNISSVVILSNESISFAGSPSLFVSTVISKSQEKLTMPPSGSEESLASNITESPVLITLEYSKLRIGGEFTNKET